MSIVSEIQTSRMPKTNLPILPCVKNRFSPRVFSSDLIPQSDLDIILEAPRFSPSARYHQPWFFYIVHNNTIEHEKLFTCVPDRNFWAKTAPIMIITCYEPLDPAGEPNRWAIYDLGGAVSALILQATELKYFSRQIGSFDPEKTHQEFSIPQNFKVFTLIALGKMGNETDYQKADPEIVKKDLTANPRKLKIFEDLSGKNHHDLPNL